MITDKEERSKFINSLLGRPYERGGQGPDTFDCYGLARYLQRELWGLDMPAFYMPGEAGRFTIAGAISAHPERKNWIEVARPKDGDLVSMAKQNLGYHIGQYVALEGGLIVHTLEDSGVTVDPSFNLRAMGWRRIRYFERA